MYSGDLQRITITQYIDNEFIIICIALGGLDTILYLYFNAMHNLH